MKATESVISRAIPQVKERQTQRDQERSVYFTIRKPENLFKQTWNNIIKYHKS